MNKPVAAYHPRLRVEPERFIVVFDGDDGEKFQTHIKDKDGRSIEEFAPYELRDRESLGFSEITQRLYRTGDDLWTEEFSVTLNELTIAKLLDLTPLYIVPMAWLVAMRDEPDYERLWMEQVDACRAVTPPQHPCGAGMMFDRWVTEHLSGKIFDEWEASEPPQDR